MHLTQVEFTSLLFSIFTKSYTRLDHSNSLDRSTATLTHYYHIWFLCSAHYLVVSIIGAPAFWQQSIVIGNCFLQLCRRKSTNCPEINSAQIRACKFGLCKPRMGQDCGRDWWVAFFSVAPSEVGAG